jgi:hypothetical protein
MNEELTVPARGTAATGNQVVTVGCSSVDRDRAHVTVSLATGEQDDAFLYPAKCVAVRDRDGTVYRVHLLTIDESSVRVRVVGHPPEPRPQPSDSAATVRVKETLKSCRAALESIVAKHIPEPAIRMRWSPTTLTIHEPRYWLFDRKVLEIQAEYRRYLFDDGEWIDVKITVLHSRYLKAAQDIANSYHSLSRKGATILKDF